jgi:hypothetical protein
MVEKTPLNDLELARQVGGQCLAAALDYLKIGWAPLALCHPSHLAMGKPHCKDCSSPGKRSWHRWKEFQERLPTERELRGWWAERPHSNVGLALGPVSGVVRIDVEGESGERLLRELSGGDLPRAWEMTTGKGRGLLYRIPPGVVLRTTAEPIKSGEELRLQALGAQTVLPPSVHPSGRRYAWTPGDSPFEFSHGTLMPAWLVAQMRADVKRRKPTTAGTAAPLFDGPDVAIPEGGRHSHLLSLAGAMRRYGADAAEIAAALCSVNARLCRGPLGEAEVQFLANDVAGRYPPAAARAGGRGPRVVIGSFTLEGRS